jgi:hypothetical protein
LEIHVRNVNEALAVGIRTLLAGAESNAGVLVSPRGQRTLEWYSPVVTTYDRPTERVLFSHVRDANPFFHLFESLWMLAGRQDLSFLEQMNKRMAEFSDDGKTFYGAYGFRWRKFFGLDQIQHVVQLLKDDNDTRRAVITMWTASDLRYVSTSKDIPCNTHIYFKIRDGVLRTTVCCRSNDMLWGAYGANGVHFSMLHEYIANKVGVQPGMLTQLSDSFHVYLDGPGGELWRKVSKLPIEQRNYYADVALTGGSAIEPLELGAGEPAWDADLFEFFRAIDAGEPGNLVTPWFRTVVEPLWEAWKTREIHIAQDCAASDWRTAAVEWLERRMK